MKAVFIYGDYDYSASMFENLGLDKQELFDQAVQNNGEFLYNNGDIEFYVRALEFGDVDKNFLSFLEIEMFDEDHLKHRNYYIIED